MRRRLEQLDDPQAGRLPGDVLEPLEDLPRLEDLPEPDGERARELLDQLAVVKLNGGLGTSMGLSGPKSLLTIKTDTSFLDVIAAQVLALRERFKARLPLLLMNSAGTRPPSLEALHRYDGLREQELPLDFLQGREPKLRADDLQPVSWPDEPGAGVVPARARRPLHRADRVGHPGRPARRGPALGLRVQLGQPGGAGRRAAGRLDRRPAGAVHDGGGARDAGRPQGRAPRPPRRAGRAARDRAGARGRHVVHRRRALALLQHQQPVDRPARAAGAAGRRPGRAVAAADRQPEDRRPPGQGRARRCSSWRRRWARPSARSRARGRCRFRAPASPRSRPRTTCSSCGPTPTS